LTGIIEGSCKKQERRFGANFKNAKHFEIGSVYILIPFTAVVCNTCYILAGQLQVVLILILRTIMMGCNDIVIGYLIVDMCIGMNVIEVSR
jgi:hypothetical protein